MKPNSIDRHSLMRIYEIDKLIRDKTYPNSQTLAKQFELNSRTILRDIEAMRYRMGFEIEYDAQKNGYYYTKENKANLPPLQISEGEWVSLLMMRQIMPQLSPKAQETTKHLFQKLAMLASDKIEVDDTLLSPLMSMDFGQTKLPAINEDIYSKMVKALQENRTVKMTYYTTYSQKTSCRELDPYHLRFAFGGWYIMGFCHLRQDIKIFSLSNVQKLEITRRNFVRPEDFSPEKMLGNAWRLIPGEPAHVKLKFSPDIGPWVSSRQWHKTQTIQELEDGSILMELDIDGLSEINGWVLSFGSGVEVLEPKELIDEIKEEVRRLNRVYL